MGHDTLVGGKANDLLRGGNDNDRLWGSDGNDVLIGDKGSDVFEGGAGNDRMIWNDGDGSDIMRGGAGYDTTVFNGSVALGDEITLQANGGRAIFQRTCKKLSSMVTMATIASMLVKQTLKSLPMAVKETIP
ncbi:MAG: hypothetical protein MUD14_10995 [Hydrococcus sp. Prado102]|nr:hypothetical protein [Hydrococcus sp. Prado102]